MSEMLWCDRCRDVHEATPWGNARWFLCPADPPGMIHFVIDTLPYYLIEGEAPGAPA